MTEAWGPDYVIAERYRLVRELGRGGMGSVWVADHMALQSHVAIKLIDSTIANSAEALDRFMREAKSAAALRSPHVVQTFDYGVHAGVPFIVMELLEGESLAERLARVGPLPLDQTARIISQVSRAMIRAHEAGIVHRDLKPDNVFLVKNDEEDLAKVLDFGIAKSTSDVLGVSSQTRTGAILGTPYYMSPEQAEGNKRVDHRTDLWALAVIVFECVVGKRPFESDALGDLVLRICARPIPKPSEAGFQHPGFDAWFAKATERDPALRFQSARELSDELRAVAGLERAAGRGGPSSSGISIPARSGVLTPAAALTSHPTPMPLSATNFDGVPRGRTPVGVVAGATVAGLGLVGAIAFYVLGRAPDRITPTTESPAVSTAASPAAPRPSGLEPTATLPTVEPAAPVVVQPAASPAPSASAEAEGPSTSTSVARSPKGAATKRPPAKKQPSTRPDPPPDKPSSAASATPAPKRVDFGF